MFNFNEVTEISLRTWYPKDHELHLSPHQPLGKLLGEWGELLDDYMKSVYKPGYEFEPIDELGDIWYYLRILCYQRNYEPSLITNLSCHSVDRIMAITINEVSTAFIDLCDTFQYSLFALDVCYSSLVSICNKYNITLQQLTENNWNKLKPGSIRGEQWMKAREMTNETNFT